MRVQLPNGAPCRISSKVEPAVDNREALVRFQHPAPFCCRARVTGRDGRCTRLLSETRLVRFQRHPPDSRDWQIWICTRLLSETKWVRIQLWDSTERWNVSRSRRGLRHVRQSLRYDALWRYLRSGDGIQNNSVISASLYAHINSDACPRQVLANSKASALIDPNEPVLARQGRSHRRLR